MLITGACAKTTAGAPSSGGSTSPATTKPAGGNTSSGGSSAAGGSSGSSSSSATAGNGGSTTSAPATGGIPIMTTGGSTSEGGATNTGGATSNSGTPGSTTASGGTQQSGGSTVNGGTQQPGGSTSSGGTARTGGSTVSGGNAGAGGTTGTAGAVAGGSGTAVSYKLPPPDQCHDQDYIPYDYQAKTGCLSGDKTTDCGGKCQVINACSETTASKPNADVTFMCQRNQLFSPEMEQAAADDGNTGFHYAVVGHDVDRGGIDGTDQSACCQCYQLVYAWPSPANDRQVQVNPDNPNPPASAIPVPPPLIVQAFNTAATPQTFDVYMPAGGLGANNACAAVAGSTSQSGQYMYTSYPADGQPSNGGVKPASLYSECKTAVSWVTTATLTSAACVQKTADACNKIVSSIPGLTNQAESACIKANSINTFYHLNWSVYAMKVECPENLTRVTGCKLAPQSLPSVKKNVTTAAQAAQDPAFLKKTGSTANMYETTTMEDCCRPSCAAINWISAKGLVTDPQYRAFYSCDAKGVPYTQPQ